MRVLIANRGEIAARIAQSLRAMAWTPLAIFEPDDAEAPHVWLADRALPCCYLDGDQVLDAARRLGAQLLHPGYGFLSQNADFAAACAAAGIAFIGPSPAAMREIGDKRAARSLAERLGVPVIPGASACDTAAAARAAAEQVGYPLLLKAAGGGGGRGMRRVDEPAALAEAFAAAQREAQLGFRDPRLLLERLVRPARHIEVQVFGDGQRVLALGTRECSLQRRYQKVVEETPPPTVAPEICRRLEDAAVVLMEAVAYAGAGTVEFLVDEQGGAFFLEVNPRLQVEHPVTEACRGIDLVAWQCQQAVGAPLPKVPPARGHAIEVRLNAEDPAHDFLPSPGLVARWQLPALPGLRVDAGVAEGQAVSPNYDPLLAKVIAWGADREQARRRLVEGLRQLVAIGPATNQGYLLDLLSSKAFVAGETFTHSLEAWPWQPPPPPAWAGRAEAAWARRPAPSAQPAGPAVGGGDRYAPWSRLGNFGRLPCS